MGLKKCSIKKAAFILISIVVALQIYKYCKAYIFLYNSDVIVRVDFHALEYMFHVEYEYYLVNQDASCKIPESMAKKYFGKDIEERRIYDDRDTACWSVSLDYSGGRNYDFNKDEPYVRTSFGDQYRISYRNWSRDEVNPGVRDIEVMRQVSELLFDGTIGDRGSGDSFNIVHFMITRNKGKYLIEIDDFNKTDKTVLLRIAENGDVKKVLELSEGYLGYCYFFNTDTMPVR